jgi:hypothetical protein
MTSVRARASALEARGRWNEAGEIYEAALQQDPSLGFAQEGKERAAAHGGGPGPDLQAFLEHPERLLAPATREKAAALLRKIGDQPEIPENVRVQGMRLQALLGQLDSPVHVSVISDGDTDVTIADIGQLGAFGRRDIDLKPGYYVVIGTRARYREVRRDITVAPGEENATINITCTEPLPPQ